MSDIGITITTGKEIHNDKSCQVTAFWCPSLRRHTVDPKKYKETFISAAAKTDSGVVKGNSQGRINAVKGHSSTCGYWDTTSYVVSEGTVFKFYVNVDKGWGNVETKANIYVQCRKDAPLVTLRIPMIGCGKSELDYVDIIGRFDVLKDPTDVKTAGVVMKPAFEFMTSEIRTSRASSVIEIAPELAPKKVLSVKKVVVVDEESGNTVERVIARRTRRRSLG